MNTSVKYVLTLAAAALMLSSCNKEDFGFQRDKDQFTVNCGEQTVSRYLRCSGTWSSDCSETDWITLTPESAEGTAIANGGGAQEYKVNIAYNKGEERIGTYYLIHDGNRYPVTVIQTACTFKVGDVKFSGNLKQGRASLANLIISYSGATGSEKIEVSAAVSGEAKDGLSVESSVIGITTPGTGTVSVPVNGTPTSLGDVTFAVLVDGSKVADVTTTVTYASDVEYPLTINTAADLASWWPNAGDATATDEVILGADIDLKGVTLTSVENFLGIFNGNGKSIKNWESATPLFSKMGGTVKNLTLDSSCKYSMIYDGDSDEGVHYCAPLANISSGSVIGCTNKAAVTLSANGVVYGPMVGGLVALQTGGIIENCTNEGKITLTHAGAKNATNVIEDLTGDAGASFSSAGGIVGYANLAIVRGCTNNGEVFVKTSDDSKITARHYIGGIVGEVRGVDVTKCTNKGNVTGEFVEASTSTAGKQVWIAGIAGGRNSNVIDYDGANLDNCDNYGAITLATRDAVNSYLAGIAGQAHVENPTASSCSEEYQNIRRITGCNNYGKIVKDGVGQVRLGGISGAAATCLNCINSGEIVIENCNAASAIGGIVGYPTRGAHPVSYCTNKGNITTKSSAAHTIGGIFGQHGNTSVNHGTNNVNCTIKASSAQAVGFIWCANSGYTSTCTIGSATEPCKVKGTLIIGDSTTTLSESNYLNYLVGFQGNKGSFPVVNNAAQMPAGSLTVYASYGE